MDLWEKIMETLNEDQQKQLQQALETASAERGGMEKQDKVERFRRLNQFIKPGQILFAGSSLMEQFPIYEFLQDFDLPLTIYNRGVGGYTTTELMEHMDACIYDLKPAHIFINIGTNDMNTLDYTCEGLMENYRQILKGIREELPEAKLYLLAYYPVNPSAANDPVMQEVLKIRTNARITEANKAVAALAEEFGAVFLDVNDGITDEKGDLKAEYTIEGMHMYATGYKPVFDALRPVLESLRKS